jgi:hypothetical protein
MWTNFASFGTRRSSRVALLRQPSVARCAAIPLRLLVVAGALLLDLLFHHFKLEFPDRPGRNQAAEDHSTPDSSALSEASSSDRRL